MSWVVHSSPAAADVRARRRLHSYWYLVFTRIFALMLTVGTYQIGASVVATREHGAGLGALLEGLLRVALVAVLACWLWFRPRPVYATSRGLELGVGNRLRVIAWECVADVREMPWIRFSPPWYPKLFQVDLADGESFDFMGVRRAREIVIEFVQGAERPSARGQSFRGRRGGRAAGP